MRVIVCGGRDLPESDTAALGVCKLLEDAGATEVVSGKCSGGDAIGERAAKMLGLPVKPFPFKRGFGKAGGPMRNQEMAEYADMVIALPGNSGTRDMRIKAQAFGLEIIEVGREEFDRHFR